MSDVSKMRRFMKRFLLFLILTVPMTALAHDDFPTEDQIQEFLSKNNYPKIEIYDKDKSHIRTIYLRNHEKAYVLPVSVYQRGRNDMFQTALVRPTIGEARVLEGTIIKSVDAVYDLDNDKVSELVVSEIDSGQGSERGRKAIVQIDGWSPVVLHERPFTTNQGAYGDRDARSHSEQYLWEFVDLNGDGTLDLKETGFIVTGRDKLPPITELTVKEYLFLNGKFVPRESNRK
jgi:hypothetical protein